MDTASLTVLFAIFKAYSGDNIIYTEFLYYTILSVFVSFHISFQTIYFKYILIPFFVLN